MPNFRRTHYGVVTRISIRPAAHALYRTRIGATYVEAIGVHYDHALWSERFLASWPEGSAAHMSYWNRIANGPDYPMRAAVRSGVSLLA